MQMRTVAVIAAGIAAARYLKSEGFEPVIFEQGERIGGQWGGDLGHSGVWPAMRTNTSLIMTAFSDLPHNTDPPTYPTRSVNVSSTALLASDNPAA
jgi:cation diffusion facilitator CzcD-associated flavoprotein CzcO